MCEFLNCFQDLLFHAGEVQDVVCGRQLAVLGGRRAGIGAGGCFSFLMTRRAGDEGSGGVL